MAKAGEAVVGLTPEDQVENLVKELLVRRGSKCLTLSGKLER